MSGQTEIMWGEEAKEKVVAAQATEWPEYNLNLVYDFASGLSKPREEFGFGFGFLAFKDVFHNYFLPETLSNLVNSTEKERKSGSIKRGDLFLTRTSETQEELGMSSVALKDYPDATFNGFTKRLRPKGTIEVLPEFAGFFFRSPKFRAEVTSMSSVTTRASLNNEMMSALKITVPSLPEQRAIANVLSCLNDKIDLLHRQNATLEALAETLFRQWFVEQAKEEWEEGKLGDVINVKGGTTPSTKESEFWEGNVHWTTPRDLSNHTSVFMFDTERKITEKGLAKIGSGLLPIGTVLLSSRAPIGYLAITNIPLAINQGYIAIICDKLVSNYFMFLWCKVNLEEIKSQGNGSVFQEISKSTFKEMKFTIPPKLLIEDFDVLVEPYFEKIRINQTQIRTLSTLRDTLLPKLMSGEVRVAY
ncbi:restriction endonuclease subunit S [Hymenobacter psychrophilus]|uniref:Type I restriction enzyme, S subunit n=1 Tax=Hymenobacter psychrophilus TaxID=651662 RepID=A0A1H3DQ58_9BACT|nr:restriction endonuclease subunit S [Hymenobacter psychrophilus]SDX68218.1 type I restriction enzyme, S subunit [Hymenobacter psychrophilus]